MHPAPQLTARIGRVVGDIFHVDEIGVDAVTAQVLPKRLEEIPGAPVVLPAPTVSLEPGMSHA